MDDPLNRESNTLSLISWLLKQEGQTFSDQCLTALQEFDSKISRCKQGSEEWHRLIRTKAQIGGFIRHDREAPFDWYKVQQAAAA